MTSLESTEDGKISKWCLPFHGVFLLSLFSYTKVSVTNFINYQYCLCHPIFLAFPIQQELKLVINLNCFAQKKPHKIHILVGAVSENLLNTIALKIYVVLCFSKTTNTDYFILFSTLRFRKKRQSVSAMGYLVLFALLLRLAKSKFSSSF